MNRYRKITFYKRLLTSFVCTSIIVNLFPGALANTPSLDTLNSNWENTISLSLNNWDADTAFTTVTGEMTKYSQGVMSELESTSDPDIGKIMSDYGMFCVYLNWVCSNIYFDEDGQTVSGGNGAEGINHAVYTIFGLPAQEDGTTPSDTVKAKELIDSWGAIADKLRESNLLPTSNDIENKTIDSSPILNAAQISSSSLAGMGDIADLEQAEAQVRNILRYYCDANILMIIYQDCKDQIGTQMDLESLSTAIDDYYEFDPGDSLDDEDLQDLVKEYKEELIPYLNVYKDICVGYTNLSSNCLEPMEYDSFGDLTTFRKKPTDITESVSNVTKSIYAYLFDDSGSSSEQTSNEIQNIDATGGILDLLSTNCKVQNGEVIVTGDGGAEAELTEIGYTILAAGCTYDPFISIAGNDAYMETINSFVRNESDKEAVKKILQTALNTKKPLYVTDGSRSSWTTSADLEEIPVADYRHAFLADVLQIKEETTRAYAVIKGQMGVSDIDSDSWEYVNSSTTENKSITTGSGDAQVTDSNASGHTVAGSSNTLVLENKTVGGETLTASSDQMTMPIMITSGRAETATPWNLMSSGFAASVGGLTSMILHNAAADAKDNTHIANADKELLFVNGLGDIVLLDGTVILPAIANPLLYNYGDDYSGATDEEYMNTFRSSTEDYKAYYPYTAAFMNHYPVAHIAEDESLSITADSDVDKFVLLVEDSRLYSKRIKSIGENNSATLTQTGGVLSAPIYGCSFRIFSDPEESYSVLNIGLGSQGIEWYDYLLGFIPKYSAWGRGNSLMITKGSALNADGISFFPLVYDNPDTLDGFKSVSGPLTTSALRFISISDQSTGLPSSKGTFRVHHYLVYMVAEGLMGTQYADTMVKNMQVSYEDLVADQGNRFLNFLVQITDSAIGTLGVIDGVLAIKGPYENEFFNAIVSFVQQFYLLFAVALLVIVAAKFVKGHYNFIYVVFIGVLCIAGFEVYANWMPVFVPKVYTFAVNDAIENVTWSTVAYKAESYSEAYKDSNKKDPISGALKPYTATVTLYTLTNAEMEQVAERIGVDISEIRKGKAIYLDGTAGIFIQGNQMKLSVDKLLVNNTMRGLYQSQWETVGSSIMENDSFIEPVETITNDNPYTIQLTNPYTSLESYYMPYNQFERAFMTNLNTFASIFRIQRNTYSYNDGEFYKDAFLVSTFVRSGIFTDPGNDETLKENIVKDSITGSMTATEDEIIQLCNDYFYPQEDWLNLRSVFENPSPDMRSSLWGHRLLEKGWYKVDPDSVSDEWIMTAKGEEEITDLILYINNQTKKFVIEELEEIKFCSDENAIKIISLYATTCFTGRLSEIGNWLYPNYLNAEDIELQDVLYGAMTTVRDKNFAYDGTVTNTVALNLGIFGVLFVLLITVLSAVFIFVITYLIPILYALFGAVFIFKLINNSEGVGLVKGYIKITITTAVLYLVYSLGLQLVRFGGYNWYGYLGCLLVTALCVYFLFWTCLSVVQDIGELGNNTLSQNLLKGLNAITRGAVSKFQAKVLHVQNGINHRTTNYANTYGRSYNIDDTDYIYGRRTPRDHRYNEYGRQYYDEDSYYNSSLSRGIDRFSRSLRRGRNTTDETEHRGQGITYRRNDNGHSA